MGLVARRQAEPPLPGALVPPHQPAAEALQAPGAAARLRGGPSKRRTGVRFAGLLVVFPVAFSAAWIFSGSRSGGSWLWTVSLRLPLSVPPECPFKRR